jgi:hypothetical protein
MDVRIKADGELEELLKKHRKRFFPHISGWKAYFLEIAKQRAEKDAVVERK